MRRTLLAAILQPFIPPFIAEGRVGHVQQSSTSPSTYEDAEIALVYLVDRSDKAKELLAGLLGRTEDAIALLWRWIEHADFPPEAYNRIQRQVEWAEERLGNENRGTFRKHMVDYARYRSDRDHEQRVYKGDAVTEFVYVVELASRLRDNAGTQVAPATYSTGVL